MKQLLPKGLWPLWTAGFVSTAGDSMHQVALMWLIYELTGSATATGLVGMAQYLPSVLVGLLAGAAVDRLDRKRVMIASDAARVVLVSAIPVLYLWGAMSGVLLGLIAFAIALFTTLFLPARDSIVPQVVAKEELVQAGSVMQAAGGFAYFAGPIAAAALLPIVKLTGLFFADAATYLLSLSFLLLLRPRPQVRSQQRLTAWSLAKEGLGYMRRSQFVRGLLLITAIDNLFIMGPALVGTPLYVRLHLGLGAGAYAALQGSFAAGMIVGSLLVPKLVKRMKRGTILLWALIFDGVTFVPFLWTDTLFWTMLFWFFHSIGVPFILIPRTTLVQNYVPEEYQGRIFSMVNLTVVGLSAISCGLTGIAAEWLPMNQLYAVIGVSAGVVGCAGWLLRDLRDAV